MIKTVRLFDADAYLSTFDAEVLECSSVGDGRYKIVLDRTAFFPEEGGQTCDTGLLGGIKVTYVSEENGIIYHLCDGFFDVGARVVGEIDFEQRFRKMQNHTGEHIVSGLVFRLFGYTNVGFHLNLPEMTVDLSGELDREQLEYVEMLANRAVFSCLPVRSRFPSGEELASLEYRSKLELTENVRIVEIGDIDRCACCAPHVRNTGEVGLIKILDCKRYKGGVRLHVLCGFEALNDYRERCRETCNVSNVLSVKQNDISRGVERLLETLEEYKKTVSELKKEVSALKLEKIEHTCGNLCLFEEALDAGAMRRIVNAAVKKCGGICAVFSGNDTEGYKYIMASQSLDMKEISKDINASLGCRGGGSSQMIQGSCTAKRSEIVEYFGVS